MRSIQLKVIKYVRARLCRRLSLVFEAATLENVPPLPHPQLTTDCTDPIKYATQTECGVRACVPALKTVPFYACARADASDFVIASPASPSIKCALRSYCSLGAHFKTTFSVQKLGFLLIFRFVYFVLSNNK